MSKYSQPNPYKLSQGCKQKSNVPRPLIIYKLNSIHRRIQSQYVFEVITLYGLGNRMVSIKDPFEIIKTSIQIGLFGSRSYKEFLTIRKSSGSLNRCTYVQGFALQMTDLHISNFSPFIIQRDDQPMVLATNNLPPMCMDISRGYTKLELQEVLILNRWCTWTAGSQGSEWSMNSS